MRAKATKKIREDRNGRKREEMRVKRRPSGSSCESLGAPPVPACDDKILLLEFNRKSSQMIRALKSSSIALEQSQGQYYLAGCQGNGGR
jgi:hypothetical protein